MDTPPATSGSVTNTGSVGILAAAVGVMANNLQTLETGVRLITELTGLVVAVLTLITLWRNLRKKKSKTPPAGPLS